MTAANFLPAEQLELQYEGGWSDNPADSGGPTMEGVTLHTLSHFLGKPATVAMLRTLQPDMRNAIYHQLYWNAMQADALPSGVDLICFDGAIQHGPYRATVFLQTAAGVMSDGIIGPATIAAVAAVPTLSLIEQISAQRDTFYKSLSNFPTFGKGWLARLTKVTMAADQWASHA